MTSRYHATRRPILMISLCAGPLLISLLLPGGALAAAGEVPGPGDIWTAWNASLPTLLALILAAWVYLRGAARIARRTPPSRRWHQLHRRTTAFCLSMGALVIALVSPLNALGTALLSARMTEHMVLLMVAPPLLVLSAPLAPVLLGLPGSWRRRLVHQWAAHRPIRWSWRAVTAPGTIIAINIVVLWSWHVPPMHDLAMRSALVHVLEPISFFLSGWLMWWTALQPVGRRTVSYGIGIAILIANAAQHTALGLFLTFSTTPWYPGHAQAAVRWGLTPLDDQHLAGVVMWIPADIIALVGAGALLLAWLRSSEREARRDERSRDRTVALPASGPRLEGGRS